MSEPGYTISADYLGGDLDAIDYIGYTGRLSFDGEGTIQFSLEWFGGKRASDSLMSGNKGEWRTTTAVAAADLVSIGTGDANQMRTLTRTAVGGAIGGDVGALVGAATSKRNARLLIAFRRDGVVHASAFGVDEGAQVRFIDTVKRWRRDRGFDLPDGTFDAQEEAVSQSGEPPISEGVLVEVRDLLREIRDLLSERRSMR